MRKKLLSPCHIGNLELKNRIAFPPMATNMGWQGDVTEQLIAYHEERARGGCALNMLGASLVETVPGVRHRRIAVDEDRLIPGLKAFTDRIHAVGGKASIQLVNHGRVGSPEGTGSVRHLASMVKGFTPLDNVRVMTRDDINHMIKLFAEAAARAKVAGFDAVELHGSHGYLINQFISPLTNHRTDEYGGTPEKRMRFAIEILEGVRNAVGKDYPIFYRLTIEEMIPGGLDVEQAKHIAAALVEAGADAIDVTASIRETKEYMTPPSCLEEGWLAPKAGIVRRFIDKKVPVLLAARIVSPNRAEEILQAGEADLVGMGRAQIADPYLVRKVEENREDEIAPCLSCNEECINAFFKNTHVSCAINPRAGNELLYPVAETEKPLKILVVGGGVAGMSAAYRAAQRGHDVTLMESGETLGGKLKEAAAPPYKEPYAKFNGWMVNQLKKSGVKCILGKMAQANMFKKDEYDKVILATGSAPVIPQFCQSVTALTADAVLNGAQVGNNVLILGGGLVGCETAEFLARQGKRISIVEMRAQVAHDMESCSRTMLLKRLDDLGVKIFTGLAIENIAADKTVIAKDKNGAETRLEGFDDLVIALGYQKNSHAKSFKEAGLDIAEIGDCREVGKISSACASALQAVYEL